MTQGSPVTLSDGRTGRLAVCKGCGEGIAFVYNEHTGKWSPWNLQPDPKTDKPVSHFASCSRVEEFRRPKGAEWA